MYKPLCVLHVSGAPGTRASSRRARQSVGIATHVLGQGRRGGGEEWGPPGPPPAGPPARPTSFHRAQRVERMGCCGVQTLAEIRGGGGAGPSPGSGDQRPLLPKGTSSASGPVAHLSLSLLSVLDPSRAKGWSVIPFVGSPDSEHKHCLTCGPGRLSGLLISECV